MSAVVAENITIDKGTTFEETFYFTNDDGSILNLANNTVTARLRKHPLAETYYTFTCNVTTGQGAITLIMTPAITATLPSGRCVYDIIVTDNQNKKKKLVEGNALVKESVSQ